MQHPGFSGCHIPDDISRAWFRTLNLQILQLLLNNNADRSAMYSIDNVESSKDAEKWLRWFLQIICVSRW